MRRFACWNLGSETAFLSDSDGNGEKQRNTGEKARRHYLRGGFRTCGGYASAAAFRW